MAGNAGEDFAVGRSFDGISSGQLQCQSGEAIAEWRSSEQVENGIPSTSPPYWDTDEDDDDCGPKPSELYGKYTWKIDKFSQINKRELRSNAFEVGGYKWYILIYPQGCDVCNHLSLFLCVANHDKLLPGWSHFAQFTIAVVNKDPKKSKYSDTLHRFWKKEHDWGWKKFMELSKLLDGFIDADTLIIKAQVQVIRERVDRPFRCLDRQYRRELVRVYLTNVEQICRRFVEERRGKLGKLIEDKVRWSSFRAFWLGMDQSAQYRMSREKMDSILKVVVKHFFVEKEVTSTLVMDSLYSGLKALECQNKSKKGKGNHLEAEEQLIPIVHIDKDVFTLVDDVLLLLERAALEPLPPKDEKGPQNRTKDGASGEDLNRDSIERDEKRLTELGRRTIEIFFLAHIFSKIEVAYQEAVAWKRQEELIREEEATEQKAKRGTSEKEKKSKRKQGKQKRNHRKGKEKGKDEKTSVVVHDKVDQEIVYNRKQDSVIEEEEPVCEKADVLDFGSDVSDSLGCVAEILMPDSEDRDVNPVNWDTDTSEVHPSREGSGSELSGSPLVQNVMGKNGTSIMDDSSSTCSTDSVPSVTTNAPCRGNLISNKKSQKSPVRGRNRNGNACSDFFGGSTELHSGSFDVAESECQTALVPCNRPNQLEVKKVGEIVPPHREGNINEEPELGQPAADIAKKLPTPRSPTKDLASIAVLRLDSVDTAANDSPSNCKEPSDNKQQTDKGTALLSLTGMKASIGPTTEKACKPIDNPLALQVSADMEIPVTGQVGGMSRPLSAPLIPWPRPSVPIVSMVQTAPLLARSVSAAGRLSPESSHATHGFVPQSYRNAMMGNHVSGSSPLISSHHHHSINTAINSSATYSQVPSMISAPMYLTQSPERMDGNSVKTSFSFGMVNHDVLQNGPQWMDCLPRDNSRSIHGDNSPQLNEMLNFDLYKSVHNGSQDHFVSEYSVSASTSGRPSHGLVAEEFPHLDIINDLLDDEHGMGRATRARPSYQGFGNGPHQLSRQFTFPGDMGISNEVGPSTSSCRFERSRSYQDDGLQHSFGYQGGVHFDPVRDMMSQTGPSPYSNGQIDGLIPNHWQIAGSDLSILRNTENDAYPYHHHMPDYTNLACGVNGYAVFRPSNGH